jgi:catechol 2,3-dioxygenase-like lactoylglutathione lyase family enzyme
VSTRTLDHVAFWVTERDPIVERCERLFGMHVIDRQEHFTLVGRDARRGKLTLFDADGPRERGALDHVGLRVSPAARAGLDDEIELGEGILVRLVEAETDVDFDLDHVALVAADPRATAHTYERFGFSRAGETRVEVGRAWVDFVPGDPGPVERPLLNHVALLVDSAEEQRRRVEADGIEIESTVDAANTRAVFVWAPDGVRIEYVEHKETFSLT